MLMHSIKERITQLQEHIDNGILDKDLHHPEWHKALKTGHIELAKSFLQHHLSPDQPINTSGMRPIIYLLQNHHPEKLHGKQTQIVQQLLGHKCDLLLPDRHGLIPADYAIISNNIDAARAVLLMTILAFNQRGKTGYQPNYKRIFSQILPENRSQSYQNMARVFAAMQEKMGEFVTSEHACLNDLADDDIAFWCKPDRPAFDDLPRPSDDVINLMRDFRLAVDRDADTKTLTALQDRLSHARRKHALSFKPV